MSGLSRKLVLAIGGFNYGIISDESEDILKTACTRINLLLSNFPRGQTELLRHDVLVMLQLAVELTHAERAQAAYDERVKRLMHQTESYMPENQLPSQ